MSPSLTLPSSPAARFIEGARDRPAAANSEGAMDTPAAVNAVFFTKSLLSIFLSV
jgi:hypothetical protein